MFSLAQLNAIRAAELDEVCEWLRPGARILEIGAGTGQQARDLARRGFDMAAIEIPQSIYAGDRVFPITDYDGRTIPFADRSFDIVFSSNVLEHVPDLAHMHAEIRRVLRGDGYAVHVLPTHVWRLWTTLSAFPAALQELYALKADAVPRRPFSRCEAKRLAGVLVAACRRCAAPFRLRCHGERGNALSELWLFRPQWWRQNFRQNGFDVVRDAPMGLLYTGNMLFGSAWSLDARARAARWLGSACHKFEIRVRAGPHRQP